MSEINNNNLVNEKENTNEPVGKLIKRGIKATNFKKFGTLIVTILLILSVSSMLWCQMLMATTSEKIIARTHDGNTVSQIILYEPTVDINSDEFLEIYTQNDISCSALEYVKDKMPACEFLWLPASYNERYYMPITSREDIESLDFEFYAGAKELTSTNSVYLTDYIIDNYYDIAHEDGGDYSQYLGEEIELSSISETETAIISGIVKTDYEIADTKTSEGYLASNCNKKYHMVFGAIDFAVDGDVLNNCNYSKEDYTLKIQADGIDRYMNLDFNIHEGGVQCVMEDSVYEHDCELQSGEVIISEDIYKELYLDADFEYEQDEPRGLGDEIDIALLNNYNKCEIDCLESLVLKGVSSSLMYDNSIFLTEDDSREMRKYGLLNETKIFANVSELSVGEMTDVLTTLRYDYNIATDSFASYYAYVDMELVMSTLIFISIVFGVLLIVSLMVLIFMASKELKALFALGMTKREIIITYLSKIMTIAVVALLASTLLSFGLIWFTNSFMSVRVVYFSWIAYDFLTLLTSVVGAVVLPVLIALIPLRKINKMKPADAIKA